MNQAGHEKPRPPEAKKDADGSALGREQVTHQPVANPHETGPLAMPDAATIRLVITAVRQDLVDKVDWLVLEAGIEADPGDFVARLWESAQAGNSGHGVTLVSLGDAASFLDFVNESVERLQTAEDQHQDCEVAVRVQKRLTETADGSQWLLTASRAAVGRLFGKSPNPDGAKKAVGVVHGTTPEDETDDDFLLI